MRLPHGFTINILLCSALFLLFILFTPSTPLTLVAPQKAYHIHKSTAEATSPLPPVFDDQTLTSGIHFAHQQGDAHLTGINETLGSGACVLDYNNDGWMDLFLVNGSGQTRYYQKQYWWQQASGHSLYQNLGNARFKEVTKEAGLAFSSWGMGCVAADFDNDGFTDLFITNLGQNQLYKNSGEGSFIPVTEESGIVGNDWSTSATVADYDGDGLLDIYVANYVNYKKGAKTYETQSQFESKIPVTFNATLYDALPNQLFRNLGNFRFAEVSQQAGVEDKDGRSLDASWVDVNSDQHPDLFVSNDGGGGANTLFINQGNGKFKESGTMMSLSSALGHHALSQGDIDNDGDSDLLVTSQPTQSHLLLINEGNNQQHTFSDKAKSLGLAKEQFAGYGGWGAIMQDFNNDGLLDVFTSNGLITPDPDTNKIPQGQGQQLWINQGNNSLQEVTHLGGIALQDGHASRGTVYGDFDNDGDMDIYVANNNDLGQLLINQSKHQQWLGLHLTTQHGQHRAIGAKVLVDNGAWKQNKPLTRGDSFLSSSDPRLHFGLGNAQHVTVRVLWPDGKQSQFDELPLNQYLTIDQLDGLGEYIVAAPQLPQQAKALQLSLDQDNAASRARYIQWMGQLKPTESLLQEITIALQDKETDVRLAAIKALQQVAHADGLTLLISALDDPEPTIRQAAVIALRDYESEISIRWLLRMFGDNAPQVRQATAENFAFFFREEEAVIYRKYLAIPYLIKLLDDNASQVKISAIRALGDAERFRAVSPLIQLLNDSESPIQAESTRALGLLREQRAIDPLLTLFNSHRSTPEVLAQIIIALKRLSYTDTEGLMDKLLAERTPQGLETLNAILSNKEDGVVISQQALLNCLMRWFIQQNSHISDQENQQLVQLVEQLGVTIPNTLQQHLTTIATEEIRAQAYRALLKKRLVSSDTLLKQGLHDRSPQVRNAVLESAATFNLALPKTLLMAQLKSADNIEAAIAVAARQLDSPLHKQLHTIANDENISNEIQAKAITHASQFSGTLLPLSNQLLNSHNEAIQLAVLHYLGAQLNQDSTNQDPPKQIENALLSINPVLQHQAIDTLLSLKAPWARKKLIGILDQAPAPQAIQQYLLKAIQESQQPHSATLLIRIINQPQHPLREQALKALINQSLPLVERTMWKILDNHNEPETLRLLAAESLFAKHGEKVIAKLQTQQGKEE